MRNPQFNHIRTVSRIPSSAASIPLDVLLTFIGSIIDALIPLVRNKGNDNSGNTGGSGGSGGSGS